MSSQFVSVFRHGSTGQVITLTLESLPEKSRERWNGALLSFSLLISPPCPCGFPVSSACTSLLCSCLFLLSLSLLPKSALAKVATQITSAESGSCAVGR